MPARSSHAPWRLPCDLRFFFACLPESEVQRIFLYLSDSDTRTALEVVDVLAGKFSIISKLARRIIDVSVSFVSIALVDQSLHECDDLRDVLRYLRMNVSLQHVESFCIVEIFFYIFLGNFRSSDTLFLCPVDDLVIDISEVLNEFHFIASELEVSSQCIEHDKRTGIAYMEEVVDRWAADIHLYLARFNWYEFFFSVRKSVIDLHFSSFSASGLSCRPLLS